jgi:hypothetical protein
MDEPTFQGKYIAILELYNGRKPHFTWISDFVALFMPSYSYVEAA